MCILIKNAVNTVQGIAGKGLQTRADWQCLHDMSVGSMTLRSACCFNDSEERLSLHDP